MRQTKKGNQWYFGMKAHIGVDARTKLIHSVATTPANVHDSQSSTRLCSPSQCRTERSTRLTLRPRSASPTAGAVAV